MSTFTDKSHNNNPKPTTFRRFQVENIGFRLTNATESLIWILRGGANPLIPECSHQRQSGARSKRPTFEPPSHLREKILLNEQNLGKDMEVEVGTSHPKASHTWEPGNAFPKQPRHQDM
jgi:hypothetical protein